MQVFNTSHRKRLRCLDMEEFQKHKKYVEDYGINNLKISFDADDIKPSNIPPKSNPSSSITNNQSIHPPLISNSSNDTLNSSEDMSIEVLIKGKKFVRKVDFLIDNLIRKTRKLNRFPSYDFDSNIPNTIGPQPTTDHAISQFRNSNNTVSASPTLSNTLIIPSETGVLSCDVVVENAADNCNKTNNNVDDNSDSGSQCGVTTSVKNEFVSSSNRSNDVSLSHTDWDMDEIDLASNVQPTAHASGSGIGIINNQGSTPITTKQEFESTTKSMSKYDFCDMETDMESDSFTDITRSMHAQVNEQLCTGRKGCSTGLTALTDSSAATAAVDDDDDEGIVVP